MGASHLSAFGSSLTSPMEMLQRFYTEEACREHEDLEIIINGFNVFCMCI